MARRQPPPRWAERRPTLSTRSTTLTSPVISHTTTKHQQHPFSGTMSWAEPRGKGLSMGGAKRQSSSTTTFKASPIRHPENRQEKRLRLTLLDRRKLEVPANKWRVQEDVTLSAPSSVFSGDKTIFLPPTPRRGPSLNENYGRIMVFPPPSTKKAKRESE